MVSRENLLLAAFCTMLISFTIFSFHMKSSKNLLLTITSAAESSSSTCNYTDGEWVPTTTPPLYNGTTCRQTIKDNQNCISHGRPDLSYLYYQWKPRTCKLPQFHPSTFLTSLKHKHLAFVGDSMARNQLESLICLLSSFTKPQLIYSYPAHTRNIKFRRWLFPSHNVTISVYWSPFLVKGIEKSSAKRYYNTLYVDSVDQRWAKDLPEIDMVVLTAGHWYPHQALYLYKNGSVLGCRDWGNTLSPKYPHIEFYDVYRMAYKTALKAIFNNSHTTGNNIEVVVTTFTPSHFERDWDKLDACPKTKPFGAKEVEVRGFNAEMRRIVLEEVEEAGKMEEQLRGRHGVIIRVTALDVTKLSLLRPDGHPGPYMNPFPFANYGVKKRVHNDCLHFCLPGPIDTWNQIMLDLIISRQILVLR